MGYTIQALIADKAVIAAVVPTGASLVQLPQGKAMIPFSERMREAHGIPFLPLTDEGSASLPDAISAVARCIATTCKVVYVEAEFFGGNGTQACVTWDVRGQPSKPIVQPHAINTALRFLGVEARDHHDEFDALGLGRYRDTDDWERIAESARRD